MITSVYVDMKQFLKQTKKKSKQTKRKIYIQNVKSSMSIATYAKMNLVNELRKAEQRGEIDGGNGLLLSAITPELTGKRVRVYVSKFYAPYVEFGTGPYAKAYLANKPAKMKKYAWKFKKPKDGNTKEMPFLFPAAAAVEPAHIYFMKKILKQP